MQVGSECPSDHAKDITTLNAESKFLLTLKSLHAKFPDLKIGNSLLHERKRVPADIIQYSSIAQPLKQLQRSR
jgi:hypothetical protein